MITVNGITLPFPLFPWRRYSTRQLLAWYEQHYLVKTIEAQRYPRQGSELYQRCSARCDRIYTVLKGRDINWAKYFKNQPVPQSTLSAIAQIERQIEQDVHS